MKISTAEVSYRKKNPDGTTVTEKLGDCQYNEYDSIDEAVADLGPTKALEILQIQVKTLAMNNFRDAKRPGGMSKTALRNEANARITSEEMVAQIQSYAARGLAAAKAIEDLIEAKIAEIQAEQGQAA